VNAGELVNLYLKNNKCVAQNFQGSHTGQLDSWQMARQNNVIIIRLYHYINVLYPNGTRYFSIK
jgi:hypothetical protein